MNRNQVIKNILAFVLGFILFGLVIVGVADFTFNDAFVTSKAIKNGEYANQIAQMIKNDSSETLVKNGLSESLIDDALASYDFESEIINYINYRIKGIDSDLDTQIYSTAVRNLLNSIIIIPNTNPKTGVYDVKYGVQVDEITNQLVIYYAEPFSYPALASMLNNAKRINGILDIVLYALLGLVGALVIGIFAFKKGPIYKYFYRAWMFASLICISVSLSVYLFPFVDVNPSFSSLINHHIDLAATFVLAIGCIGMYFASIPILYKLLRLFSKERK